MKLYELTKEAQNLEELYLMAIDEETGEVKDIAILEELEKELNIQLKEKGTGIIKVLRNSEAMIEAIKNEEARLAKIRKIAENRQKNFKKHILNNMLKMGIKKIETEIGSISWKNNPPMVEIYDETLIAEKFKKEKINYVISKTEIKNAIEKGEEVQGARIIINQQLKLK